MSIEVFGRIRPSPHYSEEMIDVLQDEGKLILRPTEGVQRSFINNQRQSYQFKFKQVFDRDTTQDEIFSRVAKESVTSVLSGYNATIFAYGQTGSGKTYTMTGGPGSYEQRGIIPRCIDLVFKELNRADTITEVWISYLQVYKGKGYDLLGVKVDESAPPPTLKDLPQIQALEDEHGDVHTRGLSAHNVTNAREALHVLFDGDTNRMVAATAMNEASSRSHCIFTINIRQRRPGGDAVRRSKLNLVDLAGSERVAKTGAEGEILEEAMYINGSLFALERVIHAISEKQNKRLSKTDRDRIHIPYRSSVITTLLRDSLGGNCRATMVANLSGDPSNLGESIGTCRFAHRVAQISNTAVLNEETDPRAIIKRLKVENRVLRRQVAILKGEIDGDVDDGKKEPAEPENKPAEERPATGEQADEVRKLRMLLRQRDAEIEILTNMLSAGPSTGQPNQTVPVPDGRVLSAHVVESDEASMPNTARGRAFRPQDSGSGSAGSPISRDDDRPAPAPTPPRPPQPKDQLSGKTPRAALTDEALAISTADPADAVEMVDSRELLQLFLSGYGGAGQLDAVKDTLHRDIRQAKALGGAIKALSGDMDRLKRAMAGAQAVGDAAGEEAARADLGSKVAEYRGTMGQLKAMKVEIDERSAWYDNEKKAVERRFKKWISVIVQLRDLV